MFLTCNVQNSGEHVEFAWKLRLELGDQRYEDLYRLAHTVKKWERTELEQMIIERKEMLNKFENGIS